MTRETIDSDYFDGTITDGSNEILEIDTSRANDVIVLIDDGNTDSRPEEYTMTQRIYESRIRDYQFYDKVTGENARSWVDSAWGEKMQFEFENTSGSDSKYRIIITSYREMS